MNEPKNDDTICRGEAIFPVRSAKPLDKRTLGELKGKGDVPDGFFDECIEVENMFYDEGSKKKEL